MTLAFAIFAILTLAGAVAAMTLRRLVHCALALTIAFAGLGALYVLLGAEFAGLVQILVYAGAVAILIVFAILLTGGAESGRQAGSGWQLRPLLAGGLAASAVFAVLGWSLTAGVRDLPLAAQQTAMPPATVQRIGDALMGRFLIPLEAIGLMLTAALIGAVMVAMEEGRDKR